jgi:hypothetical protein
MVTTLSAYGPHKPIYEKTGLFILNYLKFALNAVCKLLPLWLENFFRVSCQQMRNRSTIVNNFILSMQKSNWSYLIAGPTILLHVVQGQQDGRNPGDALPE